MSNSVNTAITISPDLQQFIDLYEPDKFKVLKKGIEIRGIKDLHRHISRARALIARMDLKLVVLHDAQMISFGGFEVNNI